MDNHKIKKISKIISYSISTFILILFSFFYDYAVSSAATPTIVTITSSQTWNVPNGVTSLIIQAWGGGGGGQRGVGTADGGSSGGGGGGGEYRSSVENSLGATLTISVGVGGSMGSNGGDTSVTGGDKNVTAKGGGAGGIGATGAGIGGTGGTGQVGYSGGNGYKGVNFNAGQSGPGGGGGSSAGYSANGNAATSISGATAPSGGGNGGSKGSAGGTGETGSIPGGGGGGGDARTTSPYAGNGGAGGSGQVIITYYANGSGAYLSTNINVAVNPVIIISDGNSGTTTIPAITPTASGRMSAATDSLSVSSNDTSGYKVTIEMTGSTNTLSSGSNNISAASGTTTNPAVLTSNTWGFCVPNNSGNGSYTVGLNWPGTCDGSLSSAAISTGKYAAVPVAGSPFILFNTASSSVGTYNTVVTFAAAVDNTQPSGTYTGTVVFTAVTN